jgi:hypothetical protein
MTDGLVARQAQAASDISGWAYQALFGCGMQMLSGLDTLDEI